MKVVILDGYVDEPSNFGVPPYISPYPRYVAGAVRDAGHEWEYVTIDRVRAGHPLAGDLLVLISGPIVPGKYLRSLPISEREIVHHASAFQGPRGGASARGARRGELPARGPSGFLQLSGDRTRHLSDAAHQRPRDPGVARRDPRGGPGPQSASHGQRRSRDDARASGRRDGGDARPRPAGVSR